MSTEQCIALVLLAVIFYKLYIRYHEGFDDARAAKIHETYGKKPIKSFSEYARVTGGSTVEYHDMRLLQHANQMTLPNIKRAMD